jgi:hypothetical protein
MHDSFLHALQTQCSTLRQRWETLLRLERLSSPMAQPDALVYLMNWTLDSLFNELKNPRYRRHQPQVPSGGSRQACTCGKNPMLGYFSTGEQAIIEVLFVSNGELSALGPVERSSSLVDLKQAFEAVARREIDSFCAVCQTNTRRQKDAATGTTQCSPT